jgi:hypothetical protein
MLRANVRPARDEVAAWTETLIRETRELMAAVLPLADHELQFLERLNGAGEIVPALLTEDAAMQRLIATHPGLQWKAQHKRKP